VLKLLELDTAMVYTYTHNRSWIL